MWGCHADAPLSNIRRPLGAMVMAPQRVKVKAISHAYTSSLMYRVHEPLSRWLFKKTGKKIVTLSVTGYHYSRLSIKAFQTVWDKVYD